MLQPAARKFEIDQTAHPPEVKSHGLNLHHQFRRAPKERQD